MAKRTLRNFNPELFQEEVARELGIDLQTADQTLQRDAARQERLQNAADETADQTENE